MTKAEKVKLNQQIGRIWMELRALQNSDRKNIRRGIDWVNLQKKHRDFIESNEEVLKVLMANYPNTVEDIKNLRYTSDIDKTVSCLNAIQVIDD